MHKAATCLFQVQERDAGYGNERKVQKECHASPEGGADVPQYTTDKDVLVFGLFFGHGGFCTIDERKVQEEYHTSPRGADIPQCPANKDVMIFGLFSGHGIFCIIDGRRVQKEYHTSPRGADIPQCVVFTASGGGRFTMLPIETLVGTPMRRSQWSGAQGAEGLLYLLSVDR